MELLVIILVLVYSVWSEVAKKKEEEKVDIDFSELASLDDFFKDTGSQAGKSATPTPKPQAKPQRPRAKKRAETVSREVNYDNLPALTGQLNRDAESTSYKSNYDELPQLTGVINYDRMESRSGNDSEDKLSEETRKLFARELQAQQNVQAQAYPIQMTFDRDSVIKAFVMSEVLQRYDLGRIYSRIPDFNQPEE